MAKFRKKPVEIEAITFAELVEYGKANGGNIVNGMPWSFSYKGHPITHENDERYLIPTLEGTHNMTPVDMLITGVQGEIYPCKMDIFEATYVPAEAPSFQDRVKNEKIELDTKATALSNFIGHSSIFETLEPAEQERLKEQNDVMWQYSEILGARIAAFAE